MSGYTTGSDNLMSSDGTFNYKYDADGNTISRTQIASTYSTQYLTTYTWDYRNRLTDVEYYDNNAVLKKHVHYVYGVFDHLLATEVDPTGGGTYTQIQHYVLDVSPEIPQAGVPGTALAQPDLVFDGSGNLIERNLVALNPAAVDAVVAEEAVSSPSQAGVVTWVADDHLGSPVDVVHNSGAEDDHIVRSAFGQVVFESNSAATPWAGFGGGHEDPASGMVNDDHRWYDPAMGRWIAEDPSGFLAGDANLTRYVANAPAGGFDVTGLQEPAPSSGSGPGPLGPPFFIGDPSYGPPFNDPSYAPPLPNGGQIPTTSPFYTGGKYPPPVIVTPSGPIFVVQPKFDPTFGSDGPVPVVPPWPGIPCKPPPGYHPPAPRPIGELEPSETPGNYGGGIRIFPSGWGGLGISGAFGPMTDKQGGYEGSGGISYVNDDWSPGWSVRKLVEVFSASPEPE